MKTKTITVIVVIAVLLVLGSWFWFVERVEAPSAPAFVFQNEAGESISVSFNNENETASLNGAGYNNLIFKQVISASGARYENEQEGLTLWNKGNDVTLYKGEEIIFSGTAENASSEEAVGESEGVLSENNSNNNDFRETISVNGIFNSDWVWLYTDLSSGERVTTPEGGRFVLSLSEEGSLSSQTDCNTIGGNFVIDGEVLSFGQLFSSKMFCVDSQEQVYSEQLALVSSYEINGETLKLNLNRDFGVMYFVRK